MIVASRLKQTKHFDQLLLGGDNISKKRLTINVECVKSQLMIASNHQSFVTFASFELTLNAVT